MHAALRWTFIIFFVSHIPVTMLVDSQVVLPEKWFPQGAKDMLQDFIVKYRDPLVRLALIYRYGYVDILTRLPSRMHIFNTDLFCPTDVSTQRGVVCCIGLE